MLVTQECEVKICDFGMARSLSTNKDDSTEAIDLKRTRDTAVNPPKRSKLTEEISTRWYRAQK